jgi:hypothetical protein
MPTKKQVLDMHTIMSKLYPTAKLLKIGPDGLTYSHEGEILSSDWDDKPFSAPRKKEDMDD